MNAGGSFTGGSRINKSGSIISRKQEIESLYTEISKLRQTTREKEEAYNQYRSEVAKMDIEAEGMQDRIREIDSETRFMFSSCMLSESAFMCSSASFRLELCSECLRSSSSISAAVSVSSARFCSMISNAEVLKLEKEINELHRTISEAASDKEKFSREVARLEERRNAVQRSYDAIVSLLFESYELTVSQATEQAKLPDLLPFPGERLLSLSPN